ncbi:hypothetical protein [Sinorhizobium psoraleae]|uniref:hypothetical protein n=1 Tax=Sinorhizobium psoraleae TaxID=520838 RepID=UPI0022AFDF64|nr:hypothetical protein [Sinorhizobium psoraleae]
MLQLSAMAAAGPLMLRLSLAQSTSSLVEAAKTAGEKRVVVSSGSGVFGQLMDELFFQPFTKATGISISAVDSVDSLARLKAMVQSNNIEWDLAYLTPRRSRRNSSRILKTWAQSATHCQV